MHLTFLSEEIRMDKEVNKIYHVFVRDGCYLEKLSHAGGAGVGYVWLRVVIGYGVS